MHTLPRFKILNSAHGVVLLFQIIFTLHQHHVELALCTALVLIIIIVRCRKDTSSSLHRDFIIVFIALSNALMTIVIDINIIVIK